MADPILPSASSLVTPAIDAIVALRPEALAHFNNPASNWSKLAAIWRAQILVNLARVADEVKATRLQFATGEPLRALAASEFNTTLPPDPQYALATVSMTRTGTAAGTIRAGTQYVKTANPAAVPLPIGACTYAVKQAVYVPSGQLTATVLLEATRAGADGNVPTFSNYSSPATITPSTTLFDATFATSSCTAAGGSSGVTDDVLRAACKAYWLGQFGPTDAAIVAGAFQQQSVRHLALFPAGALPYAQLYVADQSWSHDAGWEGSILQAINDSWLGFGCRVRVGYVSNRQIVVSPTIVLKSTDDLNDTTDIDANVRAATRDYFDGRPDWYRWKAAALQALLGKADSRILHCLSVTITDAVTGATIADSSGPTGTGSSAWSPSVTHLYLTDDGVQATYEPPN